MSYLPSAALALLSLALTVVAAQEGQPRVDKTIEIIAKDSKLMFIERGKDNPRAVTVVVGQTVRWENKDLHSHRLVSIQTAEGQPLFDTGVIKPGKYKDVIFKFDVYRRAGGKPANAVEIEYRSLGQSSGMGKLQLLSAARR